MTVTAYGIPTPGYTGTGREHCPTCGRPYDTYGTQFYQNPGLTREEVKELFEEMMEKQKKGDKDNDD